MAECRCYRCNTDMFSDSYTDPSIWIGDNGVEDIEEMFCDDCHHIIQKLIRQRNEVENKRQQLSPTEYEQVIGDINYKLTHNVFVSTSNYVFKEITFFMLLFCLAFPFLLIFSVLFGVTFFQ